MALKDKNIDPNAPVDERVAAAIRSRLEDGRLSCVAACGVASELEVTMAEVGHTADQLEVRLNLCQLGFFGFPGGAKGWEAAAVCHWPVPEGFREALLAAGKKPGEISCGRVWEEADRFGVPRLQAGWLADELGLTVRNCHLGAF